jgi:hypothetical protein
MKSILAIIYLFLIVPGVFSALPSIKCNGIVREVIASSEYAYEQKYEKSERRNRPPLNQSPVLNGKPAMNSERDRSLLLNMGQISINFMYATLVWRSLTLLDIAAQNPNKLLKFVSSKSLSLMVLLNIVALIANIFRPMKYKNLLKVGLGLNVVQEWIDLLYNVFMISLSSDRSYPREFYFGRLIWNLWFTVSGLANLKSRWVFLAPRIPESQPQQPDPNSQYQSKYRKF